jgi:hypothetical protein
LDAVQAHALDRQALYDGWVGALGSVFQAAPGRAINSLITGDSQTRKDAWHNVTTGREQVQGKETGKRLNWSERMSEVLFNPVLYEINAAK